MYAIVYTKPDISQIVSIVSRYMHNLDKEFWQTAKWILWYTLKILDVDLLFKQNDSLGWGMIEYVNSNYASDLDKLQSTTGYVFTPTKRLVN